MSATRSTWRRVRIAGAAVMSLATAAAALAGEFSISPMRVELAGGARTSAITVRNDDAAAMSFQIRGMRWSQGDDAADHYEDATDLIYFPRLLTIEPGKEGVIRVGTRPGAPSTERTYRLFIEELSTDKPSPSATPQVKLLVRFAAPVFVKPAQTLRQLQVEGITRTAKAIGWTVSNRGNEHELFNEVQAQAVDAAGKVVATHQVAARYLLAGRSQAFTAPLEPGQCERIARVIVTAKTEKSQASGEAAPVTTPCR